MSAIFKTTPNKRMQSDQSARYARTLAADAGRYVANFRKTRHPEFSTARTSKFDLTHISEDFVRACGLEWKARRIKKNYYALNG